MSNRVRKKCKNADHISENIGQIIFKTQQIDKNIYSRRGPTQF